MSNSDIFMSMPSRRTLCLGEVCGHILGIMGVCPKRKRKQGGTGGKPGLGTIRSRIGNGAGECCRGLGRWGMGDSGLTNCGNCQCFGLSKLRELLEIGLRVWIG